MSDTPEETIWKGTPSAAQDFWLNLSCLFVLPIPWAIGRWVQRRNNLMEITTERLRITSGVLSKKVEELELYRVRDTTFLQPFILRLFRVGNLKLNTDDATTPTILLGGIPADQSLRDRLRHAVEACRDRKRTRVSELGGVVDTDNQPSSS